MGLRALDSRAEAHLAAARRECAPRRVVGIHHDGAMRGEIIQQTRFRVAVRLHRAVVVEMVAREIGEDDGIEDQPLDAMLVQRVGRHFHGHVARTGVDEDAQRTLKLDRSRRSESRVLERAAFASNERADGADGRRPMLWPIEQMPQHVGRGGLSVRAGDADESKRAHRPVVRGRRHDRCSLLFVTNDDRVHAGTARVFDDRSRRARLARVIEILMAVALTPAHRDEQTPALDAAAVVID